MVRKIDNGNFVDTIKNKTLFDRFFTKMVTVFSDYVSLAVKRGKIF